MNKRTIILLTKTFPYGHKEVYIAHELPYLASKFNKVIIIPYDEYHYDEKNSRTIPNNCEVFKAFNIISKGYGKKHKIRREFTVWKAILSTIASEREWQLHLKHWNTLIIRLRYLYDIAYALNGKLQGQLTEPDKIIFYNYWLHYGVFISHFYKNFHTKTHIIARSHSLDLYHKDWEQIFFNGEKKFLPFETFKIKHTDTIYAISRHGFNHLCSKFPSHNKKFKIAYLGVEDSAVVPIQGYSKKPIIVSCSSIQELKRVYLIPELLSNLKIDFEWHHFGSAVNKLAEEKVLNQIRQFNINDKCFLHGETKNDAILEFYKTKSPELFINLSTAEGLPVSIMEAYSYAIPALATNIVAVPEIVNSENGFLVDVNFISSEIGLLINNFLHSPTTIYQKRINARKTFLKYFNAKKNYKLFLSSIED